MNEAYTLTGWLDAGGSDSVTYANEECLSLLQRCLAGQEVAYVELYNQHASLVYRLAFGLLQNKEDAEEVLQDSFEYAFRKLNQYNPQKSAFTTWLYRITVSRCRNKRRRKWLSTFPLQNLSQHESPRDQSPTPDSVLELDEQQTLVWEALTQLSNKLREAAILRYYHGLRYKEIGDVLGIPAKTAESRVRLARKALKDYLQNEIGEIAPTAR